MLFRDGLQMNTPKGEWKAAVVLGSIVAALGVGVPADGDAQSNRGYGGGTPNYHEVTEGDTLYDLSGQYYGDVKQWPRLWSYNPHITNPHWIYPGDIVYLRKQQSGSTGGASDKGAMPSAKTKTSDAPDSGLRLGVGGFVVKDEAEFVGRIVDSPKEARMLAQYDSCWVGFGEDGYSDRERQNLKDKEIEDLKDPGGVKRKDRFAIVEEHGKVTDDEGDVIGTKYLVLGSLVVTKTREEKLDTAYIDQSWREIERGAFLMPYDRQTRLVQHEPADKDLVAKIVDSLTGHFDFGESHYVFVDKGASDGVRIGNRMFVYQHRTGLSKRWNDDVPEEIPYQRVGRVRIVDVTENYSTAIITDSKRELNIGDRLEMYQGN